MSCAEVGPPVGEGLQGPASGPIGKPSGEEQKENECSHGKAWCLQAGWSEGRQADAADDQREKHHAQGRDAQRRQPPLKPITP